MLLIFISQYIKFFNTDTGTSFTICETNRNGNWHAKLSVTRNKALAYIGILLKKQGVFSAAPETMWLVKVNLFKKSFIR